MDSCSSAEDLIVKTRKPYTITKQRERWTEEEHNRFLEALKLYGRAWQRIEDHIGSKTAVQIRSHAQKFFSKLEKEALFKGIPVSQTLDIDIPPPRPKRKPSFPYPRKTSTTIPASQIGTNDGKPLSSECPSQCKEVLDLEKEPAPERSGDEEKTGYAKQDQHENCSKGLTGLEEAPCSSVCSERKGYIILPTVTFGNASTVTEFVLSAEKSNQDEQNSSYVNGELEGNENLEKGDSKLMMDQDYDRIKGSENSNNSPKLVRGEKKDDPTCGLLVEEMQATQNYPRHVPLHVLDGRLGTSNETLSSNMTCQGTIIHPTGEVCKHPNPFVNPAVSASTEYQSDTSRSSVHQTFSAFQPSFTQIQHNEYNYRSFLPISPFSSHIVSTLLQNPAANFPASFWPYTNLETLPDFQGGIPPGQMNSSPSMAAIAAATVSAATAWWAAHGLLPLCTPLHSSFACAPVSTSGVSSMDTAQALSAKKETGENFHNLSIQDHRDPEYSEALQVPKSASKLPTPSPSPSRSEECGVAEPESGLKTADLKKVMADIQQHDTNQAKRRRLVDRSSCGSNTVSSSEVETDALEKHDTAKEELKEQAADPPASESSIRHIKTINNINDSWKEVSEEGRLAFKALFTREVLPQSFSPSPDIINKEHHNSGVEEGKEEEKNGHASLLDLNRKTWNTCSNLQEPENNTSFRSDHVSDGGLLTIGLGLGKLKSCRAGFRPYKRCSVEAKENRVGSTSCQVEEKVPKRLRIKGEAST